MPFKITQYPAKVGFNDGDLYDVSSFDGVSTYTSEKMTLLQLKAHLESTLGFIATSEKGATNGVASLVGGLVPSSQLPSFVDDVLEFADFASFPVSGETGKIYIALDTNKTFRWSGSVYVEISTDSNIYNIDGTLTGNRNVDLNSNTVTFEDAVGDGVKYYKASGVNGATVGFAFDLQDDLAGRTNYAKILGGIKDEASGAGEGFISFEVLDIASSVEILRLLNNEIIAQKPFTTNSTTRFNGLNFLLEQSTPLTPSIGLGILYSFTNGTIHYKNDAGVDFDLTAGAGGSSVGLVDIVQTSDGAGGFKDGAFKSEINAGSTYLSVPTGSFAGNTYGIGLVPGALRFNTASEIWFTQAGVRKHTIKGDELIINNIGSTTLDTSKLSVYGDISSNGNIYNLGGYWGNRFMKTTITDNYALQQKTSGQTTLNGKAL